MQNSIMILPELDHFIFYHMDIRDYYNIILINKYYYIYINEKTFFLQWKKLNNEHKEPIYEMMDLIYSKNDCFFFHCIMNIKSNIDNENYKKITKYLYNKNEISTRIIYDIFQVFYLKYNSKWFYDLLKELNINFAFNIGYSHLFCILFFYIFKNI